MSGVVGGALAGLWSVAAVPLVGHAVYSLAVLAAGSVVRSRPPRDRACSAEDRDRQPKLAALIAAHDEEAVIGALVRSLRAQDYRQDRLDVLVVADHCSDATAARAAEAGARVLERCGDGATGKPAALLDGLRSLADAGVDAVVVLDADNLVGEGFARALAERLADGERCVQGLVDAKNPAASWTAAVSALGFWAIAGVMQEPRERLGLSSPVMGTALAIRKELLDELLTGGEALTDDLELVAKLALRGTRVAYERRARVLDEKPVSLRVSLGQRHRWMQGRWSVAARYVPRLLARVVEGGAPLAERARAADAVVQLLSPSLLFTSVALGLVGGGGLAVATATRVRWIAAAAVGALGVSAVAFVAPAATIARFRPPAFAWLCYPLQPAYLILSLPLAVSGWVARGRTVWVRTPHGE